MVPDAWKQVLDPGKWVLENRYQSLEMDMSILDVKNGCAKTGAILALKNKCLMLENRYYTVENGCYTLKWWKQGLDAQKQVLDTWKQVQKRVLDPQNDKNRVLILNLVGQMNDRAKDGVGDGTWWCGMENGQVVELERGCGAWKQDARVQKLGGVKDEAAVAMSSWYLKKISQNGCSTHHWLVNALPSTSCMGNCGLARGKRGEEGK